ncbi:kinase/pyrophosphorylase [Azotobacter vinelandii]
MTIDSERLAAIRHERKPNSRYSSFFPNASSKYAKRRNCCDAKKIPFINSTHFSVEEISAKILVEKGVERRLK